MTVKPMPEDQQRLRVTVIQLPGWLLCLYDENNIMASRLQAPMNLVGEKHG
jgi:hypothetical protein